MIADIKKRALHRAKIIEGQLRGIQKMLEDEEYCMDIVTQNMAIQKSISSLNKLIIENHIRTHVKHGMASGDKKTQEESMQELMKLYELYNVRSKSGG